MSSRTLARLGALPLAAGLLVAGAGAAAAHVTVTPSLTSAGSYSVLTFSVGHGCDGSPTTKIAIQMPEQVLAVTPTRNPEWEVEKQMATLDEPVEDAHGNEITERVDQVVYTARTPLPDGYRDTFELQLQLPDAAGETLTFPTIQTCEKGETAWIETPSAGQDPESLESPAPSFTLDEAEVADEADAEPVAATADETDETEETEAADDGADALGIAGLVAGLLGLAAGVAALVLVRRRA
ncbi:YcnI family protein [Nocardioides iriomotensis]|uniref:DUF1775 domain-containing protein n=1 Tax=Nocardioides iriomotensis TaxID=715784 RepID=A0A4Q5IXA1_9ACTN|nr:YcnI family protein [Nocardioides iriomotensis]RYU10694.1 DUF1775 domain-containing protein [Nocardioides iriomotensis]